MFKRILMICILVGFIFTGCDCVDKGEVTTWKESMDLFSLNCSFPISIQESSSFDKKYKVLIANSIQFWNAHARALGSKVNFFTRRQLASKKVVIYSDEDSARCNKRFRLEQKKTDELDAMGYSFTDQFSEAKIVLCSKKYEHAMNLTRTPAIKSYRSLRLQGVLNHEMGHLLGGPKHPTWQGRLMRARPWINVLSQHYKEVLKKHVIERCKLNK